METRLLTITSDNADLEDALQTTTNFTVDLGNNTSDLAGHIVGFSVESVGFTNLLPNIRPGWAMTVIRNGLRWVVTIPGNVFYSINKFAEQLQFAMDNTVGPGLVTVSVLENGNFDGGDLLQFQVNDVGFPQEVSILSDGPLAFAAGITQDLVLSDGSAQPYLPVAVRTNLNGEQAVLLQTRQIVGQRPSLDGEGKSTMTIATIPITSAYGGLQNTYIGGADRPTVSYGPMTKFDLNGVDVSLRYLDGTPVFVDNTKMYVTFRIWLQSK